MKLFVWIAVSVVLSSHAFAESWTVMPFASTANLHAVAMSPGNTVHVAGDHGALFKSTDGGMSWSQVRFNGVAVSLYGIASDDSVYTFAVGDLGEIVYTTSGKGQWLSSLPFNDSLFGVTPLAKLSDTTMFGADTYWHTYKTSAGVAVGANGAVVQIKAVTEHAWYFYPGVYPDFDTFRVELTKLTSPAQHTLRFAAVGQSYYAAGDNGTFLRSNDRGINWTPRSIDTAVDVKALVVVGQGSLFAVGNAGNMWRSDNNGDTWRSVSPPQLTTNLNGVYFLNADNGVVVGDNGLILQTSDGGHSWARQAVSTFHHLRAVFGALENGATRWVAVGDSGTIVRTNTGGTTVTYSIDHDTIDFGDVKVGAKHKDTLTFTNALTDGYFTVRVSSLDPLVTVAPSQVIVDPQASAHIVVSFLPMDTARTEALLIMNHDASWIPDTVRVFGRGVAAYADLSATTVDFGIADSAKERLVTVRNPGNGVLHVSSVEIGDTAAFSASPQSFTVGPRDSATITVRLNNRRTVNASSVLVLKSDAIDGNDSVRLVAHAAGQSVVHQHGIAPALPAVFIVPNPIGRHGSATLVIDGARDGELHIRIVDPRGGAVRSITIPAGVAGDFPLTMSELPAGIYFYDVTDSASGVVATGTIVVE